MPLARRTFLALPAAAAAARPNIVFILVDDLRFDELGCTGHPFASTPNADRLASEGAMFTNAFAATPLCSPSRATFLTGQYPHTHGIVDNTNRSARSHQLVTWPRLLRDAGYETAFIGKWHMGNDDSPRPGFDFWVSFPGQGECNDPVLNVNGKTVKTRGYVTDLLTDHSLEFIERPRRRPFCVYLSHKAIHPNIVQRDDGSVVGNAAAADQFIPAERHRRLYVGAKPPRRANYGKEPDGKPALERRVEGAPPLGPRTVTSDEAILNRIRMMKAVDESLGSLLASLRKSGKLQNTMVVLTSDHGYFYGEHGLDAERRLAYEETIRIPLLIRYPRAIRAGTRLDGCLALSLDIAPTMLEAAGVPAPAGMQGRSLMPLFKHVQTPRRDARLSGNPKTQCRDAFLIEYFSDTVFPRIRNMGYKAVRTERWKYIRYVELEGMDELYDLRADPYEMRNIVADPQAASALRDMQARLDILLAETR